MHVDLKKL